MNGSVVGLWYQNAMDGTVPAGACFGSVRITRAVSSAGYSADNAILLDSISFEMRGAPKEERGKIVDLSDTPDALTGQGGKTLKVNTAGTGVEFVSVPAMHFAKAWNANTSTTITPSASSVIDWTNRLDPDAAIDLTANRYNAPVSGIYRIGWFVSLDLSASGTWDQTSLKIFKYTGGVQTAITADYPRQINGGFDYILSGNLSFELVAADAIEFVIVDTSTKSNTYEGSTNGILPGTVFDFELLHS